MKPTLCRAVFYRSKTGRYTLSATVIATTETLFAPGVEAGHVPALTSDTHVHLRVDTPGKEGTRLPNTDPAILNTSAGGTYQEFDIPFWDPPHSPWGGPLDEQPAGTWTWPPRVGS